MRLPKKLSLITRIALGVFALFLAFIITVYIVMPYLVFPFFRVDPPPPEVDTFEEFLVWRPETDFFIRFTCDDGDYLEARGQRPYFSSGPPAYIFDETGRMLDWRPDTGDPPDFARDWYPRTNGHRVSREEAVEFVTEGR